MIVCWDNLESIYLTRNGNFKNTSKNRSITYYEYDNCPGCGFPYLGRKDAKYCSLSCANSGENNPNCQKPVSVETKHKMSISGKNKIFTKEHRQNLSEAQTGEKNHEYGVIYSDVRRLQRSITTSGENNPNWRGGISKNPYCQLWNDKEYTNWLKFERDDGKCQNPQCNHISQRLCLHHINYIKVDCRPINLIALCNSCNTKANIDREWHECFYMEIMKRRGIIEI
jgi:hypothetical protein